MTTNANNESLSNFLADAPKGSFAGLILTKVGEERGPAGAKVRYGDDQVHTVIVTGFRYDRLCQRSLDTLSLVSDEEIITEIETQGVKAFSKAIEVSITVADVAAARAELVASLTKSRDGTNESTTDAVYEPLVVDGETVRGCRVYKGQLNPTANPTATPAAPVGTIYLQGLVVSSKVLVAAPNGPVPASKSAPKTVAKDALKRHLPVSKYVSYRLVPGTDFVLRAGGAARAEAAKAGITIPAQVDALIKDTESA